MTTIEVDVLELCSSTVARTPIIRPAIGFFISSLDANASPDNATVSVISFSAGQ